MARDMTAKKYRIREVCVRLAEGSSLYSDQRIQTPGDAIEVMRQEMSKYDREVLAVVNLNNDLKPINFHIVSMGDLTSSIASIPKLFLSGILSSCASFILLHNHPSGNITPSQEDIAVTKRVLEAGKIIGIPCVDHIIVAGGESGLYCSMRESDIVDFEGTAQDEPCNESRKTGKGRKVGEKEAAYHMEKTNGAEKAKDTEELSIKFGKGLAEPFTAKDGTEYVRIMIPNQDPSDRTPWASFVLKASQVHENKFGKGLWVKLPADAHITVAKPVQTGVREGRAVWNNDKRSVPVPELKSMVEFYKTKGRDSVMDQLWDMKKTAGEKPPAAGPKKKSAEMAK